MECEDEFVSCPYNQQHRVPILRMQRHLLKCEEKHSKFAVCPYNAQHRILQQEFQNHLQVCPSKERVLPADRPTKVVASLVTPKPLLQREFLPETDPNHEIWDNDLQ